MLYLSGSTHKGLETRYCVGMSCTITIITDGYRVALEGHNSVYHQQAQYQCVTMVISMTSRNSPKVL